MMLTSLWVLCLTGWVYALLLSLVEWGRQERVKQEVIRDRKITEREWETLIDILDANSADPGNYGIFIIAERLLTMSPKIFEQLKKYIDAYPRCNDEEKGYIHKMVLVLIPLANGCAWRR
jgi:hypothetical protein